MNGKLNATTSVADSRYHFAWRKVITPLRDVAEETIPAIPSLQRKLESSAFLEQSRWIPAFAGMTSEA